MLTIIRISLIGTILILIAFNQCFCWRYDRTPKIFGHQMPDSMLTTTTNRVQEKIVAYHNFFRRIVKPSAANMLEMSWHPSSSVKSQKWADECHLLKHDNATDRWTDFYGPCGQNIFVSTHKVPWYFAIKSWFLEYKNFTYGSLQNNLGLVGHYTQMVWASSHKVGCGFSKCKMPNGKPFYNYICNYCPTGNFMEVLGRPYKKGKSCGACPNDCNPETGLCTNSCPFADLWVNCRDLKKEWSQWLCRDKSMEGRIRRKHCRATCYCKNKILGEFTMNNEDRIVILNSTIV